MATRRSGLVLVLGAAVIVMGISNVVFMAINMQLDSSREALITSEHNLCIALRAQSFSSGYIYGLNNLSMVMKLPLSKIELTKANIEDRVNASANGFKTADKLGD